MKILDWYNHQGHQYEFSKLNHEINLVGLDGEVPDWDVTMRPLRDNVKLVDLYEGLKSSPDIVMWRRGSNYKWCKRMVRAGARCIGVAQTTYFDYMVPRFVSILVWNSKHAMEKLYKNYPWCKHIYIPHGFDPEEFNNRKYERFSRILTVCSRFKERGEILGLDMFLRVSNATGLCDLYGHHNEGLSGNGAARDFEELISIYNLYKVYLNTTIESAMPRSRAEAMMCGTPIVTTSHYDISEYITHNKNGFIADNSNDMIKYCNMLINDNSRFEDFSEQSRETAIKFFNIYDYLDKWNQII